MKINKGLISGIVILLLGIIFMSPVFLLLMNSFKPYEEIMESFVSFPKHFYLGNFIKASQMMNYPNALKNSLVITLSTTFLAVVISFTAAYGISHLKKKIGNKVYYLFTFGQIVPFHTIMIPLSVIMTRMQLNNNLLAIILLYCGFHCAFGIFTYVGFLQSIPHSLEEAASIDGCTETKIMWEIIFPLVVPTSVTIGILFFLWTWNDFLMPSLFLSDSALRTVTVNMYIFRGSTQSQWNLFIAALSLSIIPIIVVYLIMQKYIQSGITAGAIKQ